jgi:acyl carrier protein
MSTDEQIIDKVIALIRDIIDLDANFNVDTEITTIKGWDSLTMVNIIIVIEENFGVRIPVNTLIETKTLRSIALYIDQTQLKYQKDSSCS